MAVEKRLVAANWAWLATGFSPVSWQIKLELFMSGLDLQIVNYEFSKVFKVIFRGVQILRRYYVAFSWNLNPTNCHPLYQIHSPVLIWLKPLELPLKGIVTPSEQVYPVPIEFALGKVWSRKHCGKYALYLVDNEYHLMHFYWVRTVPFSCFYW